MSWPSWSSGTAGVTAGVSANNILVGGDSAGSLFDPELEDPPLCLFESKCAEPGASPRFTSSLCFATTSAYASRLTGELSLLSAHFRVVSHLFANFLKARFTAWTRAISRCTSVCTTDLFNANFVPTPGAPNPSNRFASYGVNGAPQTPVANVTHIPKFRNPFMLSFS